MMFRVPLVTVLLALILTPVAQATVIDFASGSNDGCRVAADADGEFDDNCALTSNEFKSWIDADDFNLAAGATGAAWVQAQGSYIHSNLNDYRIFELDLNKTGEDMWVTDLWVSADDDVTIKVGGKEIWSSNGMSRPWNRAINVFDYLDDPILVGGDDRLNFYVHDIGDETQGPTGLIFAGTASSIKVSEPSTLALLTLGLFAVLRARRR